MRTNIVVKLNYKNKNFRVELYPSRNGERADLVPLPSPLSLLTQRVIKITFKFFLTFIKTEKIQKNYT